MKYLFFVVVLLAFLPIDTITAAGFVTCDGANCSACNFVDMVNIIIKWIFGLVFVLFAGIMAVAGFGLVTSGGNQSALEAAKSKFTNGIIGLIIIMAGWLIVDTIMRGVVGGGSTGVAAGELNGWGPWSQVKCQVQVGPDEYEGGGLINESGITSSATGAAVPTGNLVVYAGYKFDEGILSKVKYLDDNFDLRVSGGYRTPERNAQVGGVANSNHLTGRATDFVGSSAAMSAGLAWAKANGAKEALIHNVGSGTHLHVAF